MKRTIKKLSAVAAAAVMAAALMTGCGASEQNKESQGGASVSESTAGGEANGKEARIGVIQFTQHASLDDAYKGFKDGLAQAGYIEGENLTLDFQNASGEVGNCQSICDGFSTNGEDLVLAIATPAAQTAVKVFGTTDVPVLFTAVTDAVEAQLVDSVEAPGKNVTGTSDMPVIKDQISIIKDVLPEVKTIGILYTSSEANSEIQAREAEAAAKELGLETVVATSSSTNDIPQVIDSVVGNVDAIYIPSDNGFASAMGTVKNAAVQNQLPVFCAVEAMIQEGGIATTAINYYELGKQTAAQAVKILEGGSASQMPVEFQENMSIVVNDTFAKEVGVTVPSEILDKAATVY